MAAAAAALAGAGCSGEAESDRSGSLADDQGPTYHADVAPILQRSCQGCHAPGAIAPFALTNYEEARTTAGLIASATASQQMPPWGAIETDECTPRYRFQHDIRLTDEEIASLTAWNEAGAPEGDPRDGPPPVAPPPSELPDATHELTPAAPYVTSGEQDEFRCFVMDPGLTELAYLNGSHVIPGNDKVVHHAVVMADPDGASAALADANGSYDCFGGFGVDNAQLLAIWAPGGAPFEVPSNVGTPVAPGSLVVMQIHYHPAGVTADPDTTRVQLRFTDQKPEYFLAPATPIGNFPVLDASGDGLQPGPNDGASGPEFRIPAGSADHVETMRFTVPADVPPIWVYGAAAHMHYVGVDMKIEVERAAQPGARECLLHEPQWNFDWQRFYAYDAPLDALPQLLPNDRLHLTCRYDNTMDNPGVARAISDAQLPGPQEVRLGEETLDEMCLTMLPLLFKAP
jgi:hypothetical protein